MHVDASSLSEMMLSSEPAEAISIRLSSSSGVKANDSLIGVVDNWSSACKECLLLIAMGILSIIVSSSCGIVLNHVCTD